MRGKNLDSNADQAPNVNIRRTSIASQGLDSFAWQHPFPHAFVVVAVKILFITEKQIPKSDTSKRLQTEKKPLFMGVDPQSSCLGSAQKISGGAFRAAM